MSQVWDTTVQQYHGGQEWAHLESFVEDFSVTTNCFGTPQSGLDAVSSAIHEIHHYPPADQEPAKSHLARFIWPDEQTCRENAGRLLLGNGASELIDLVIRLSPQGSWKPGPWDVQYKEYERSAKSTERKLLDGKSSAPATLTCIVNPNNPTGEYMNIVALKQWIEQNVEDNGVVVIDESMQLWHSPEWQSDSMTSQHDFVTDILQRRNVRVYVIHSWTKIWCCTGLRLGSIISPTAQHTHDLKKYQVPWSVNNLALKFLSAVTHDAAFLRETWAKTTPWRKQQLDVLTDITARHSAQSAGKLQQWSFHGQPFLSWMWIDVKSAAVADALVEAAKRAGTPVRAGKYGYDRPTYVRIKVGKPELFKVLADAWSAVDLSKLAAP
ncbi:hypothetical protein RI367_003636 [Sorochytrium milnesiophthora]